MKTNKIINNIIGRDIKKDIYGKNSIMNQERMIKLINNRNVKSYNEIVNWFNINKDTLALSTQIGIMRMIKKYKQILKRMGYRV